jgi:hypothetical protein
MKELTLAVSPLVASILRTRYGDPITVYRTDPLYAYLQIDPVIINESKFRRLNRELTQQVRVLVSNTLAKRLRARRRYITIGHYLHKIYQDEMLVFIQAQHAAGVPAQRALKIFLKQNGVEEDAYAIDTAYTAWKRKNEFFQEKAFVSWLKSEPQMKGKNERIVPVDPREILRAVNSYYGCGMVNILCQDIVIKKPHGNFLYIYDSALDLHYRKCRKVAAYLLHDDAKLTGVQIADIIKLTPRSIQYYIQHSKFHLDYYTDVQHDVARIRKMYVR